MSVKTYSLKKDGAKRLSAHFKVKEFACKDGSDTVLISEELVAQLEQLRTALGSDSCQVQSGYRTASHNKKIGGSRSSKHIKGWAADVVFYRDGKPIPAKTVCVRAQDLDATGVQYIGTNSTHLDVRAARYWRDERNGKKIADFYAYFGIDYPEPVMTVKKGDKGTAVRWVQSRLGAAGYALTVDGSCGGKTDKAIRAFQKAQKLAVDGRVGRLTREALAREFSK